MRPFEGRGRRGLLDLEALRGCLSAVLDELELNGLTLVQRAKARALDCGNVNEHVLSTLLRLNEAVALRRVEPLNGALRHASLSEVTNAVSLAQSLTPRQRGICGHDWA